MANVPTPHIEAKQGEIAESILLPGDPLRAKEIAKKYLTDCVQFNSIRNMFGYTGNYKGKRVSVMGTGMGVPSIGIYSYELANFYHCKKLIRTGTAGSMQGYLNVGDLVLAQGACYTSNFQTAFGNNGTYAPICDFGLLESAVKYAREKKVPFYVGNVLTSDFFYSPVKAELAGMSWATANVLAVEMETAVLYLNAAVSGAKALTILSVSNSLVTGESMSAEDREKKLTNMIEIALDVAIEDER